jgi:hypothetical protein
MQYMLVWFGNSETVVTDLPHHITLDRDLIDALGERHQTLRAA